MRSFTKIEKEALKELSDFKRDRENKKMKNKILTAIKSINIKDLATRALWTFAQGFLAYALLSSDQVVNFLITGNWEALKALLIAIVVGGVAAGLSALKTAILSFVKKWKTL